MTKDVPDWTVVTGRPAKEIRKIEQRIEDQNVLEFSGEVSVDYQYVILIKAA